MKNKTQESNASKMHDFDDITTNSIIKCQLLSITKYIFIQIKKLICISYNF